MVEKKKKKLTVDKFIELVVDNSGSLFDQYGISRAYELHHQLSIIADRPTDSMGIGTYHFTASLDLREDYAYVFGASIDDFGIWTGDYEGDRKALHRSTGHYSKIGLAVEHIDHFDPEIRLSGTVSNDSPSALDEDYYIYLSLEGLQRVHVPGEFYKETAAEALSLQVAGRSKQSYFTYLTALDNQINYFLSDLFKYKELADTQRMPLADKYRLNLKRSIGSNDVQKDPLISRLVQMFGVNIERRNDIAHSLNRVDVQQEMIREAKALLLCNELIRTHATSDVTVIARAFD